MTHQTNPYLTPKAQEKKRFALPVMAVCGLFALATAVTAVDLFTAGKALSGAMSLLILAALLTPIVRIVLHFWRSLCARRIAGALLPLTDESLTFDQLQTVLSSGNALQQLKALIGKGYLQNLQIDSEERTATLYTPEGSFVQWVCPGCGAKNHERRGGVLRCKYCEQPFAG